MLDLWKHVKVIRPSVWFISGLVFMISIPEIEFAKLQYAYHDFWDDTVERPSEIIQEKA